MTTMTRPKSKYIDMDDGEIHDYLKSTCLFLSKYASALLGCGATCIRIEKNIGRIADTFGVHVDMTLLPAHVIVVVWDCDHTHSYNCSAKPIGGMTDFCRNIELSKLSWRIVEKNLSCDEASIEFDRILSLPQLNKWIVLLLTSAANASFCRLFGGDFKAVGIVFCATLLGFFLKQIMIEDKIDLRITTIASAFLASVVGASGYLFGISNTPELALGTSVLFLIPGIPYINAGSDLFTNHYLCAVSRFIQAVILTICLTLGLCGGMFLMQMKFF